VIPHVVLLVPASADPSFPSDHATMAGAVAAGLWLVSRRLGVVALAAAMLMAFARVYVGAHYPIDVVVGLVFGAVVVLAGSVPTRPLLIVLVGVVARSPFRPLIRAEGSGARA
jgi:undecaprenyl-diphosphatase